ncbi:MAG: hypothetical protein QM658_12915 [Gordonia sp. (in: high G+C Gram-positive bacteria)]
MITARVVHYEGDGMSQLDPQTAQKTKRDLDAAKGEVQFVMSTMRNQEGDGYIWGTNSEAYKRLTEACDAIDSATSDLNLS